MVNFLCISHCIWSDQHPMSITYLGEQNRSQQNCDFTKNHIKILSKVTEFSPFALQFLPFTHFILLQPLFQSGQHDMQRVLLRKRGYWQNGEFEAGSAASITGSASALALVHPLHYFWTNSQKVFQVSWSI